MQVPFFMQKTQYYRIYPSQHFADHVMQDAAVLEICQFIAGIDTAACIDTLASAISERQSAPAPSCARLQRLAAR